MNTPVHSSRQQLCRNTQGSIVRVLNATARRLHRTVRLAMDNPTRRRLLKILATNDNGVTYQQLFRKLPVSNRWVREIVADLRREGIVETPGNPALIQFTDRDVWLAVKEVLAFLDSEWVDAITSASSSTTGLQQLLPESPGDAVTEYLQVMSGILRGEGGWP